VPVVPEKVTAEAEFAQATVSMPSPPMMLSAPVPPPIVSAPPPPSSLSSPPAPLRMLSPSEPISVSPKFVPTRFSMVKSRSPSAMSPKPIPLSSETVTPEAAPLKNDAVSMPSPPYKAEDHIVVAAAVERVVSGAPGNEIGSRGPEDHVVGIAAVEPIGEIRAGQVLDLEQPISLRDVA
jgi:hypothetical protein